MMCPTCQNEMTPHGYSVHHCYRCGTLVRHDATVVPALVGRCRAFLSAPNLTSQGGYEWDRLGIPEAIGRKTA